ncbi:histidine kinase [Sulfurifustis variabilis]|uniref:histidine kinase n=1 Tax=Sulfurifustis variabilis TaxID=1675686 RepID=A0A1B4V933_9GAMM|nr:PAS domain S-box protein [Sulfurifustis variabilis]BAU47964.1 histidine kinase [Sulfurifustis variabilis]
MAGDAARHTQEDRWFDGADALEAILDHTPAAIYVKNRSGTYLLVNRTFEEVLRRRRADIVGKTDEELLPGEMADRLSAHDRQVIEEGEPHTCEEEMELHGERRTFLAVRFPLRDAAGRVSAVCGISTDITERKQVDSLRTEVAMLQQVFDRIPVMMAIWQPSTKILRVNKEFERMTGWSTEEAAGMDLMAQCYPDPDYREQVRGFMLSPQAGWRDFRMATKNGGCIESTWANVRFSEDVYIGLGLDMGERKRAEDALRESEERFRGLAEGMPHVVWETDARGMNHYLNRVWYDYIGDGPGSSYGLDWLAYFHPDDRDRLMAEWNESLRTGGAHPYDVDARIRRHDGVYRWFRGRAAPIRDGDGQIVKWAGICTDIDDEKRAQEALKESEERFRVAQELSLDGFTILKAVRDRENRICDFQWTYVNPAAARMLCSTVEALTGKRLLDELPGNRSRSGLFERYVRVVETGEPHDIELYYDAEGIRGWFRNMAVKLGDGVAISFSDITERKRLESDLAQRAEQLAEADRRKDEFLATLAHELRNPLAPIRTSADIVRMNAGGNARLKWASDAIVRQLEHLDHLVADLLDLSRVAQGKVALHFERCDLRTIVWRAVEMTRRAVDAQRHLLRVDMPDRELIVRCDASRLVQVVANLITNSVKYTPAGGSIHIAALPGEETVTVRVRDTGEGIKADLLPHIFDLFVQGGRTLARSKGGLGIGLTLVRTITELHGGRVSAASRGPGQGAEFTVTLPLLDAGRSEERAPQQDSADGTHARRRILIVEDNRDAADSLAFLLGDLGHDVHTVYDGSEGLKAALETVPEVAILDIGLPGLNGYELARLLRQEPRLRNTLLIALSGYGQESDREQSRDAGFDHHLLKPFELDDLIAILDAGEKRS